jgi:hypothetical protein
MDRPGSHSPTAIGHSPNPYGVNASGLNPVLMALCRYHRAQAAVPPPGDGHQGGGRLPPAGPRAVPRPLGQAECGQVEPRAARHRQPAGPAGGRQGALRLRGHRAGPSPTASLPCRT